MVKCIDLKCIVDMQSHCSCHRDPTAYKTTYLSSVPYRESLLIPVLHLLSTFGILNLPALSGFALETVPEPVW